MAVNTHYRNNLEAVMQVNKNYTDKEIKASEERILSIVARNNVDFIDHINEPTYRFTAPANAKLLMLQSIAGNSNKIAPSTPSDDSVARLKTIPDNTYKSQIDYIGGKTIKYNQLVQNGNFVDTSGWVSGSQIESKTASNNVLTITTYASTDSTYVGQNKNFINGHKYLVLFEVKNNDNNTSPYGFFRVGTFGSTYYANNDIGTTFTKCYKLFEFVETSGTYALYVGARTSTAVALNYSIRGVEFIDLTDKFGAGNEPSTVETTIPLLKANGYKLDGTDEYSTGKLKHAVVSGVKYSPINLFNINDLNTNLGITINNTHSFTLTTVNASDIFNTAISFKANTQYTFKYNITRQNGNNRLMVYYTDGTRENVLPLNITTNATFTTASGKTISSIGATYGDTGYADYEYLMIVESSTAPSTYIPYVAPITKAIPSEVLADTRYGLGFDNTNYNHLDSDGHLRGSWGIVDLGSLSNWQYDSTNQRWNRPILENMKVPANNSTPANVIASKYQTYSINDMAQDFKEGIGIAQSNNRIYIYTTDSTNIPSGYLVYELATAFDQDYSQYFDTNWNKVDLDKQYATCEMVADEPIDMPNKVEYYGTIIHALATAVKYESFNKWNETWGNYVWNETASGVRQSNNSSIGCEDYISVLPSLEYRFTCLSGGNFYILYYDSNHNYISYIFGGKNQTFTTPSNCAYITWYSYNSYGTTYKNDICINESGTLNGTYKPHKPTYTRALTNNEAKYSWGITNGVRNTRVFCDDECNPINKGSLVVGNQDLGSLTYFIQNDFFFSEEFNIKTVGSDNDIPNVLISTYTTTNYNDLVYSGNDKVVSMYSILPRIAIRNSAYSTTEAFKSAMNGIPLFFEKNATDTEPLDDFDFSFDCEEGDTFTLVNSENLQCYATYSFLIKEAKSNE